MERRVEALQEGKSLDCNSNTTHFAIYLGPISHEPYLIISYEPYNLPYNLRSSYEPFRRPIAGIAGPVCDPLPLFLRHLLGEFLQIEEIIVRHLELVGSVSQTLK